MQTSMLARTAGVDVESERPEEAGGGVAAATETAAPDQVTLHQAAPSERAQAMLAAIAGFDWRGLVQSWTVRLFSLVAGVLLWHLACLYKLNLFIRFDNVPSPLQVAASFINHAQETKFYIHVLVSVERIMIGFALASVLGIVVGIMMGRSKIVRNLVIPYIEILRPIPAVAWIPLSILMWPTEESSIIYITFLGALFPIVLNTIQGVEQTPEVLVRAAQSLGASRLHIFWHVVIPAALPSIATGLAVGMGVSWFSLLAGEVISGQYGIGYFTWNAYSLINYPDIVVGMLVIGGLGTLSTMLLRVITKPLLSWQRKAR